MTLGEVYDASVAVCPFDVTSTRHTPTYRCASVLPPSCGAESPIRILSEEYDEPPPIVSSGRTCEDGPVFGCGNMPFGEAPCPPWPAQAVRLADKTKTNAALKRLIESVAPLAPSGGAASTACERCPYILACPPLQAIIRFTERGKIDEN